ncbi:hypothetical protein BSL78_12135 [Apostichopus japonicus]|uniref:Macoilin n=2 Tax=Stichopus japonicus TaxID=307972 RepID=A0A2G8KSK5_STIJA|nr:hypothetical protein BSL78_12135 [Apostichopus japonicus]
MKRRNADCGRPRRPLKRTKIAEGFYSSTFLYLKFLGIWATVLLFDFLLEFRFEYLWPVWLLLRSIYDSYKYQGLAFSIFFVFIVATSDMVCLLFIPVHWLFFVASTYVWVQLVWHTDRGVCLPTASLWLLFVYIEASVRLRELRTALPFHLDLCRPFAAHCIGYPVVTLGFGFKSYVSYRLRLRKQREVQKENDFYMQLLQQALPQEVLTNSLNTVPDKSKALTHKSDEPVTNGTVKKGSPNGHVHHKGSSDSNSDRVHSKDSKENKHCKHNGTNNVSSATKSDNPNLLDTKLTQRIVNYHDSTRENLANEQTQAKHLRHNSSGGSVPKSKNSYSSSKDSSSSGSSSSSSSNNRKGNKTLPSKVENKDKDTNITADVLLQNGPPATTSQPFIKDDFIIRLESDIKKLKADLQSSRQTESDLRTDISRYAAEEKKAKCDWEQLQKENESLQTRLHNLVTQKQQDKQNLVKMEQKVKQERETRSSTENQLREERKNRKMEEAAARAMIMAAANPSRVIECSESCRTKQKDQENEICRLTQEGRDKQEKLWDLERKVGQLQDRQETQSHNERLMSNLMVLQEKTTKLETSLSAETRLKMDLFSALGDARRQLEISEGQLMKKEQEIHDLKSKIADIMSVMPHPYQTPPITPLPPNLVQNLSVQRYFCVPPPPTDIPSSQVPASSPPTASPHEMQVEAQSSPGMAQNRSCLDPNAAIYRPKSN